MEGNGVERTGVSPHESQSTQILNFALGMAADPRQLEQSARGSAHGSTPLTTENGASKEAFSGDSLLVDASNARYHFHGLASSQTQSQTADGGDFITNDDDHPTTDSQKENTPSHTRAANSGSQAQLATRAVSNTSKPASRESSEHQDEPFVTPLANDGGAPVGVALSVVNAPHNVLVPETPSFSLSTPQRDKAQQQAKAVTFHSPAPVTRKTTSKPKADIKAQPKMQSRRRRSPTPESQDSFAGPSALQDPDLFLATSKQFVKPLNELGSPDRVETQSQENKAVAVESKSVEKGRKSGEGSGASAHMTPYSLSSTSSRRLGLGRVLVENSDDSSGPSQDSSNSGLGRFVIGNENGSSQQPTQLNTQPLPDADTSTATQIVEEAATQIINESSQLEPAPTNSNAPFSSNESDNSNILPPSLELPHQPPAFQRDNIAPPPEIPATHGSSTSVATSVSIPRGSILGLASAERLQRIQRMIDAGLIQADPRSTSVGTKSNAPSTSLATNLPRPASATANTPMAGPSRIVVATSVGPSLPLPPAPTMASIPSTSANTDVSTRAVAGSPLVTKNPAAVTTGAETNASSVPQESEQQVEEVLKDPSFDNAVTSTQKGKGVQKAGMKVAAMKGKEKEREVKKVEATKEEDEMSDSITTPSSSAPLATYVKTKQAKRIGQLEQVDEDVPSPVDTVAETREEEEEEESVKDDGEKSAGRGRKGKGIKAELSAKTVSGRGRGAAAQMRKPRRGGRPGSKPASGDEDETDAEGEEEDEPYERVSSTRKRGRGRGRGAATRGRARKAATPLTTTAKGKGKVKQEPPQSATRSATRAGTRGRRGRGGGARGGFRQSPLTRATPRMKQREPEPQTPEEQSELSSEEDEQGREDGEEGKADNENQSPDVPLAGGGGNQVDTDVDEVESRADEDDTIGRSSNKRKRVQSTIVDPQQQQGYPSRAATARSSVLSLDRPPPAKRSKLSSPTRVFALWKPDALYYVGTVEYIEADSAKCVILFDDDTKATVEIKNMRRCDLQVDDEVCDGRTRALAVCQVVDVSDWTYKGVCTVKSVADGEVYQLETQDVIVAPRSLISQWNDRTLELEDIVPRASRHVLAGTPSPSKLSIISNGNGNGSRKGVFSKMGFVVTLAPGNSGWESDRQTLVRHIDKNGGTVISEWSDLFTLDGEHELEGKRWFITQDHFEYIPVENVQKVFLLADECNQKPKYLIALGLGIPCVSTEWLSARIRQPELEWQKYLLPAGYSDSLHARVSQTIDMDWGNSIQHLSDIASSLVPLKLLRGLSILCLGSSMVPLRRDRKVCEQDKAAEASRMIPFIILTMGAKRVEAVGEARFSAHPLQEYDYVVNRDMQKPRNSKVRYVTVNWIKQCLIAGRLLPLEDF